MNNRLTELYINGSNDEFLKEVTKQAKRLISKHSVFKNDIDDLSQEVTVKVAQSLPNFDASKKTINGWVKMQANSVINNHLANVYQKPCDYGIDFEALVTDGTDSIDYESIAELFREDKELLNLLIQGYTFRECEDLLGLSAEQVRWKIEKVRRKKLKANPNSATV
jgi:DNA-directed RNA polymerase specialized sigma24 family protein